MHNILTGSALTRAMLERGDENIWCAIDDDSDEQAMTDHGGNDFTAHIISFSDGKFFCTGGMPWMFAVPVKISEALQSDVGL
ncbi:hypothetical protein RCH20_001652 [Psychrobacter sp. PL15]|jgi:hypothetical protein|uniref:hypothetical protein n=1 Tax=unclassified Psychrobacter TaxID=196806 RepID=UPI001AEA51BB|nr:hypothetical protein [Psychrobacter sp. PL15]MEC5210576.1 hypothetical protein [Psychrobacter sp. PL15]